MALRAAAPAPVAPERMLARWQLFVLNGLGIAALALVVANALLFASNRESQATLMQRQQYVQQSVALESLYGELVKALAEAGTRGNDRQLIDLLAAQGLSVTVTPPAPGASSPRRDDAAAESLTAKKR